MKGQGSGKSEVIQKNEDEQLEGQGELTFLFTTSQSKPVYTSFQIVKP